MNLVFAARHLTPWLNLRLQSDETICSTWIFTGSSSTMHSGEVFVWGTVLKSLIETVPGRVWVRLIRVSEQREPCSRRFQEAHF